TMSRTSLARSPRGSSGNVLPDLQVFLRCLTSRQMAEGCGGVRFTSDRGGRRVSEGRGLLVHFRANATGRERIPEEDRSERDGARAGGYQLERVASARHSPHADDWQLDRRRAGVDARKSDRAARG